MRIIYLVLLPLILLMMFCFKLNFSSSFYPIDYIETSKIKFIEMSEELGVVYNHVGKIPYARSEDFQSETNLLTGTPPSLAVIDLDRDGFLDLYVVNPSLGESNLVFINQEGRRFEKSDKYNIITQVNKIHVTQKVAFFDFNNDGFEDLFLTRYGCHSLFLFDFDIHAFKEKELKICSNPWAVNILDFNKDNYLDVVIGNYFPNIDLNYERPKWFVNLLRGDDEFGGLNQLFLNKKGEALEEVRDIFKYHNHTASVGVTDVDNNGWPDLFIGNDFTYDRLYINQDGVFKELTFQFMDKKKHGFAGMNSDFADINQDGYQDLYVSNIYNPPFTNSVNLMWMNQEGKRFRDRGKQLRVNKCGWSWGGKFSDFDLDGDLDLVVGNGQFRGVKYKGVSSDRDYWYYKSRKQATSKRWRNQLRSNPTNLSRSNYSGFQKTCLFERKGRTFYNIADQAGISGHNNSRATVLFDFNNDGLVDFVNANFNGRLTFYKNVSNVDANWLGLDLRDDNGSIAIGTKVRVRTVGGKDIFYQVYPLNGFGGQNDHRVLIGLGADEPDLIELKRGRKVKTIKNVPINQYIRIQI